MSRIAVFLIVLLLSGCSRDSSDSRDKVIREIVSTEDLAFSMMPKLHKAAQSLMEGNLEPLRLAENIAATELAGFNQESTQYHFAKSAQREWNISPLSIVNSEVFSPFKEWRKSVSDLKSAKIKFVRGSSNKDSFEANLTIEMRGELPNGQWTTIKANVASIFDWDPQGDRSVANIDNWILSTWKVVACTEEFGNRLFRAVTSNAIPVWSQYDRARQSKIQQLIKGFIRDGDVKVSSRRLARFPDWQSNYQSPGLSVVDIDADGWEDIYITGRLEQNLLFRNNGDGTFSEKASEFGLDLVGYTNAATFADFDNDGDQDALLGRTLFRSVYLRNEGGRFVDRTKDVFSEGLPFLVSSIAVADYDCDGKLDIFLATYGPSIKTDKRLQEFFETFEVASNHREEFDRRFKNQHLFLDRIGPKNVLLRNDGSDFTSIDTPLTSATRNSYAASWSDFDNDGDPDLYVANDFAPDELFLNQEGKFTEVSEKLSNNSMNGFGMGVTWGDFNEDGRIDLYVSNMFSKAGRRITARLEGLDPRIPAAANGSLLFEQQAGGFNQVAGLGGNDVQVAKVGWSYGAIFCDVTNNGRLDIYSPSGYYTPPKQIDTHCDT